MTQKNSRERLNEIKSKSILEQLWLHYYNNALYEKGLISEYEYDRMKVKINNRKRTILEK